MGIFARSFLILANNRVVIPSKNTIRFLQHRVPIVDLYQRTTGQTLHEEQLPLLSKKHPNIEKLSHERLQCTLQILEKFGITPIEACNNLHLFSMNPITMDNYGEILKECRFICITAKHIIKYHTTAKKAMASLKKAGLIDDKVVLEEVLLDCLKDWPDSKKILVNFPDADTSLLTIRTSVLERYLKWRLSISTEDFQKYCRNYLPLRHKPMADIQEALNLAENEIKLDHDVIRRNGFIISSDPLNTKLILENVPSLAGMDIREAVRIEPAILKNNYNALLQIRDILESYRIPLEAQAVGLKVFCMRADTVRARLEELSQLREFRIFSSNPRVLSLVIHKKKSMNRLTKIQNSKKQCYSLNHLISSSKVYNNYITSFGSKACGRDIELLIKSSLKTPNVTESPKKRGLMSELRKHKYCLHVALSVIDENLQYLKKMFDDTVISNNCQLLLYPLPQVEQYIENVLKMRRGEGDKDRLSAEIDVNYSHLNHSTLTDDQVLSLVLYEIEKKYHFSGDGIWGPQEVKADQTGYEKDINYSHLNHSTLTDDQVLSLVLYEIEKKYHFSGDGIWGPQEVKADQTG